MKYFQNPYYSNYAKCYDEKKYKAKQKNNYR